MYKDDKTTEHKRDTHGNVVQDKRGRRRGPSGFLTALGVTMALALTLTGLLLHTSIQQNEANLARIQNLQQENAMIRSSLEHANESLTRSAVTEQTAEPTTDVVSEPVAEELSLEPVAVEQTEQPVTAQEPVVTPLVDPAVESVPAPTEQVAEPAVSVFKQTTPIAPVVKPVVEVEVDVDASPVIKASPVVTSNPAMVTEQPVSQFARAVPLPAEIVCEDGVCTKILDVDNRGSER
ncbi:MAG: hypothetical protein FWC00_00225 [Firmicutes bacterium]|nr:hypothetical protein [Bacillota bacterium]